MIKKLLCSILLLITELSFGEVKELTSSYGIRFWYYYDNSAPIVNVLAAFKNSGTAHMSLELKSVPKIYSATILCGCGKYSKEEFQENIRNLSINIFAEADSDDLIFSLKYPKIVSTQALELFHLMLTSPKFPKKDIERSKFSICYYLENYQDIPEYWGMQILLPKILFKDHAYGTTRGNTEDVLKITDKDLLNFHKKYVVRSNIELCVFGDISEQSAIRLVDSILSAIPKGKKASDNIADVEPDFKNLTQNHHVDASQSFILFALPNILKNSPDRFAASILYLILGGGEFKSHVLKKLRSELGLIYTGNLFKIQKTHSCYELGILQTSNQNVSEAIKQIKILLKNLRENGITKEELAFAKGNIKGTVLVNLRTAESLCHYYMLKKLQGCSINALEEFLKGIDAVTLEQVNSLAKKLLNEDNMPILVFGGNK